MSKYKETVEYLFSRLPAFTRIGPAAYKANLDNIIQLCEALGNPQNGLNYVHVAGTNGKGSCSHMLASVFQEAGYQTGLFTSPHLKDFRERIKINGAEISEDDVIDFVEQNKALFDEIQPSFFEMTVALAFSCFAKYSCDIVVLETGLGGRLDSTNIIQPELSVITNISLDHTDLLGPDIGSISFEKAGIIKSGIPVVISEYGEESFPIFIQKASELNAPIYVSEKEIQLLEQAYIVHNRRQCLRALYRSSKQVYRVISPLSGGYQLKNMKAVIQACEILSDKFHRINPTNIQKGIEHVIAHTKLRGRWEQLGENPMVFCDTGHNKAGIEEVMKQITVQNYQKLHMVFGMMKDKDAGGILQLLPKDAQYYFCAPDLQRALPAPDLQEQASRYGLSGAYYTSVSDALQAARETARPEDLIFVGGSTFVVAEVV